MAWRLPSGGRAPRLVHAWACCGTLLAALRQPLAKLGYHPAIACDVDGVVAASAPQPQEDIGGSARDGGRHRLAATDHDVDDRLAGGDAPAQAAGPDRDGRVDRALGGRPPLRPA